MKHAIRTLFLPLPSYPYTPQDLDAVFGVFAAGNPGFSAQGLLEVIRVSVRVRVRVRVRFSAQGLLEVIRVSKGSCQG